MKIATFFYIKFRQLGTAFIFALISGGGFLLSLLIFPLIALLSRNSDSVSKNIQYTLHLTFRAVTLLMRLLCLVRLNKIDWHNAATGKNQLIIANHPTLIDYVYLVSLFPQMDCVVKSELWDNFFLRGVVRAAGYIKVEDPASFKEKCLERLANGRNLLIFPEGTRSDPTGLKPFKKGASSLIVNSTCKVQILTIKCEPPILMKSQKWYDVPAKMAVLSITAHGELDRTLASSGEKKEIKAQAKVNNYLRKFIEKHI